MRKHPRLKNIVFAVTMTGAFGALALACERPGSLETPIVQRLGELPPIWSNQDIGSVAAAGSATYSSNVYTVKGSGSNIWDNADEFQYAYRVLNGDGQIIARVASLDNTNSLAKAGVMIRETLTAGSRNEFVAVTPGNIVTFQSRTSTNGTSTSNQTSNIAAPEWLRLVRSGNTFTAYRSTDGTTWTQEGSSVTNNMAASVYVGLAVTSHNDGVLNTAVITNVFTTGGTPTALLVVGNTTLNSGDTAIKARLEGHGFTVVVKPSSTVAASDVGNKELVFISSTSISGSIGTKLRDSYAPVICSEPQLYDDMGMTGTQSGVDFGSASGQTQLAIVDSSSPLAGGLSGTVTVSTTATDMSWGVPGAVDASGATFVSNSSSFPIFGYATGDAPFGVTLHARRVGGFLFDTTAATLTLEGWTLFDASVGWAMSNL